MKTNGQLAYEAYAAHQGNKANDSSALKAWDEMTDELHSAWESFAIGVRRGADTETAYGRDYLGAVKGKAFSGGPAPAFAFFIYNRPDIAAAWEASRVAATAVWSAP